MKLIFSLIKKFDFAGRSGILVKNTVMALFSKLLTMITGFLIIPMSLKIVSKYELGLWFTISSFLAWMSLMDFGLGYGLRNKLTESLSKNNSKDAKQLISTTYFFLIGLILSLVIIFLFASYFVDWNKFLNVDFLPYSELRFIVNLTVISLALQLILRTIYILLYSVHQSGKVEFYNALIQVIIIASIFVAIQTKVSDRSLLILILINTLVPLIVLLGITVFEFSKNFNIYFPKIRFFSSTYIKPIFSLGAQFFILQVVSFVMISSQQFFVGKYFNQKEVTDFSISQKYYSLILVFWTIILTPFWSLLTEALVKNDIDWIISIYNKLWKLYFMIPFIGLVLYFIAPYFYRLWIGPNYFQIPRLDISILIFYAILCFNSMIVSFLNAFSKVKIQMLISATVAIFSIISLILFLRKNLYGIEIIPIINSVGLLIAGIVVYFELNIFLKRRRLKTV